MHRYFVLRCNMKLPWIFIHNSQMRRVCHNSLLLFCSLWPFCWRLCWAWVPYVRHDACSWYCCCCCYWCNADAAAAVTGALSMPMPMLMLCIAVAAIGFISMYRFFHQLLLPLAITVVIFTIHWAYEKNRYYCKFSREKELSLSSPLPADSHSIRLHSRFTFCIGSDFVCSTLYSV